MKFNHTWEKMSCSRFLRNSDVGRSLSPKDGRSNNCRLPDVEHVFNVLGTMESCPTYFCLSPNVPGTMESCPTYFCLSPNVPGTMESCPTYFCLSQKSHDFGYTKFSNRRHKR